MTKLLNNSMLYEYERNLKRVMKQKTYEKSLKFKIQKFKVLYSILIRFIKNDYKLNVAYITASTMDFNDFERKNHKLYNITKVSRAEDAIGRTFDIVILGCIPPEIAYLLNIVKVRNRYFNLIKL